MSCFGNNWMHYTMGLVEENKIEKYAYRWPWPEHITKRCEHPLGKLYYWGKLQVKRKKRQLGESCHVVYITFGQTYRMKTSERLVALRTQKGSFCRPYSLFSLCWLFYWKKEDLSLRAVSLINQLNHNQLPTRDWDYFDVIDALEVQFSWSKLT